MQITLSELKVNVEKYVDLADTEDIIVVKDGRPAVKIVRYDEEPRNLKKIPDEITSVEQLFGTLPMDIELDGVRTEHLLNV